MEKIPDRDNLNRAFKRVKANKGAPGVDGMTVDGALRYFRENREEFAARIYKGKYTPSPVRRVEIPKPNGGVRELGIPTVADRTLRQAIARQLQLVYKPLFSDGSCGCRPGRSARQAVLKVNEYAEQGYTCAVDLNLEKYFDTINHNILLKLLREQIEDERVVQLVKRYLKSRVMEDGAVVETEEGSPQGGPLSPMLANIYLNEFEKEYSKQGVPFVRYADDIVILAKSKRAAERLLEGSIRYPEGKLKLTVNREKSRVVSVFSVQNFKFPGFALGRNGGRTCVRVHPKAWKKFKPELKRLSSRKSVQSLRPARKKIKVYIRGWLNDYGIASMKNNIETVNGWLYHRIRIRIWRHWKRPRTRMRNLMKPGVPKRYAYMAANSSHGPWFNSSLSTVKVGLTKERLIREGFYDSSIAYQSVHVNN